MRSYVELSALAEVVLEESFVLNVRAQPGEVVFDGEFVLTPNHPAYDPPPKAERECFRRGSLRLVGVERLAWDGQDAPPATDASGERDLGHIDTFEWENGRYLLSGDWGRIDASARTVELDLEASV